MPESDRFVALQAENERLVALLEAHGIAWRAPPFTPQPSISEEISPSNLSIAEKIALFRRLFRGRTDTYPIRWESKASGKSGYAPACANEWRAGICEKPRIKCSECSNRLLIPLTDSVIYDHLAGKHTVGVYPLLPDDSCHFLAVDFDKAEWREDALAFVQSCRELGVPVALEISRSGNGAHAWVFFVSRVAARDARRLGSAIISHTCARMRQLKLDSYDRLFPNQDTMPKGAFGNLIALPLQKKPRENGYSVFVDGSMRPYPDQWAFLTSMALMLPQDIEPTILRATGGAHPLDVTFIEDEDHKEPWKRAARAHRAGWANAEINYDDSGQPYLLRKRTTAARARQSPDSPRSFPKSGVLPGAGNAISRVGQTPCDRLCRELPQSHCVAPRLLGRHHGSVAREPHRLQSKR